MPALEGAGQNPGHSRPPAPGWRDWRSLAALLAGALQAASLAWPDFLSPPVKSGLSWLTGQPVSGQPFSGQPIWWLQLLALSVLAGLLNRAQSQQPSAWRQGARLAWLFALAWLVGAFGWIYVALHTYGQLPSGIAALAALALPALLALYYALALGLWWLCAPTHRLGRAVLFAACWLLAELLRGQLFTGFAWGAVGYAHVSGPLAGYAPWLGVYGLCALSAGLAMLLAQSVQRATRRQRLASACWALGVLGAAGLIGLLTPRFTTEAGRMSVTLLQGNIPQDEKFAANTGVPLALHWYAQQLLAQQSELIIAPETAIPLLPLQLPPGYWAWLQQRFSQGDQAALLGAPLGDAQRGYTNSVVGLKPGQTQDWRYDKHQLVPFGEFIPPWFKWFTELMFIPLGEFNQGAAKQALFAWRDQKIAAHICFENLFGEQLAAYFADAKNAPTVFVNLSNLAWFGQSTAMDQHLQIARMRALEFERPFVLATNTGLSAVVDAQGRVVAQAPRDTRTTLSSAFEGRTGRTPYAQWSSHWGLWPWYGLAGLLILPSAGRRWRQRAAGSPAKPS